MKAETDSQAAQRAIREIIDQYKRSAEADAWKEERRLRELLRQMRLIEQAERRRAAGG